MLFKRTLLIVVLVLFGIVGTTHAQEETAALQLFVGTTTENPDEFVALALEGENVTIYICDGQADKGTVSIAQWFIGTIADNAIDITADNGNQVTVTLDAETATGTFTFADGTVKTFVLALSETAQFYRSEFSFGEDLFVGGWIVLEDGTVRGAVSSAVYIKYTDAVQPIQPAGLITFNVPSVTRP